MQLVRMSFLLRIGWAITIVGDARLQPLAKNTTNGTSFCSGKCYNYGSGRPAKAEKRHIEWTEDQLKIQNNIDQQQNASH